MHADKAGLFPLISFECKGFSCDEIQVIPLRDPGACLADYERISRLLWRKEGQLAAYAALYELLDKVFTPQQEDHRLSPALSYLAEHLSDPTLCNAQLAEVLGISEVYLRKLFLTQLGTTPRQYILNVRIQKAKQLLTSSNCNIAELAEECGFTNVYHFCRTFKKRTGMTPTQYSREYSDFGI